MSGSLVSLLNNTIGNSGIKLSKENEYAYYCPFCHHYKRKLQVNVETNFWHCWVCDKKGRNFYQLFKKLEASKEAFDHLSEFVKYTPKYTGQSDKTENVVSLPTEFIPMWDKSPEVTFKHAIKFLRGRGITAADILRYNIGYCNTGTFANRIIIPSYDEFGKLNFFVGRDIFEGFAKYRNSPTPKDVVGFDLFINWDEPIILVEGSFDAIAIKRNAIPLFGTVILPTLKKKIIEKNVKTIYLSLDEDAFSKSVGIIEELMNYGIEVYNVDLTDKDPSDVGFEGMVELMGHTEKMTFSKLIRYKLNGTTKKNMEIF